jgi:hypothetical protein
MLWFKFLLQKILPYIINFLIVIQKFERYATVTHGAIW